MAIQGVDYSSARPDPTCLYQAGKRFAVRYTHLGTPRPKAMTLAETTKLTNAGLRVVTIFEESAGDMLRLGQVLPMSQVLPRTAAPAVPEDQARAIDQGLAGFMLKGASAGTTAAKASLAMGSAAGMPDWAPHLFACDVDTSLWTTQQWESAEAYLRAAIGVLGQSRVGGYGDVRFIRKLGHLLAIKWQTYAWSSGQWADGLHLRQYKNGVTLCGGAVDLNDALVPNYGQWGVNVANLTDLKRAQDFARSCDPIPYKMTIEVSRNGIDCSGFMSVLIRSLMNESDVWVRLFSTGTIRDRVAAGLLPMLHTGMGDTNDFNIGVVYPWEMTSGIGHTAGTLGGLNVESRGGDGVVIGAAARGATHALFKHHFHAKIDSTTGDDDMSAADVAAINAHTTEMMREGVRYVDHGDPVVTGANNNLKVVRADLAALKTLLTAQADDETKILAAIAAQAANPTALTAAIIAGLKAEGVISVDVDEAALAGPVGDRVLAALRQVTFTATS